MGGHECRRRRGHWHRLYRGGLHGVGVGAIAPIAQARMACAKCECTPASRAAGLPPSPVMMARMMSMLVSSLRTMIDEPQEMAKEGIAAISLATRVRQALVTVDEEPPDREDPDGFIADDAK